VIRRVLADMFGRPTRFSKNFSLASMSTPPASALGLMRGVGLPLRFRKHFLRGRVNGKAVARKGMTEIIRLKFLRWWDALLLQLFLAIGTRMFGCIAISHRGDGKEIRAIHFAINQREFNISIRNFVERLESVVFR